MRVVEFRNSKYLWEVGEMYFGYFRIWSLFFVWESFSRVGVGLKDGVVGGFFLGRFFLGRFVG